VQRLLAPRSVAVIGASREPGSPGHEVLRSLLRHGFEGPVHPVNPAASHVSAVRAYADVRDIPDDVDLAVIAVPAPEVADVVRACSDKDVRGLVVVSGGFGDGGPQGRARLEEVVREARDGGMRLIGPNAMGVVNTDPAVRLHATFAAGSPPAGPVGVLSQSGALAGTFLAEAARRRLGLSAFVSIGDRADVSGNDLLQHWRADERTEVVVLHLQGFGNPRKFARIAREVSRTKPVVALKSGRGRGDVAVDALFASAGVVRVGSLAQLFETAQLFALQPLPAGRRVAVVGTSTALASLAADACREAGLEVPELTEAVRVRLRSLTGTTETANPVDLGPFAGADELRAALEVVLAAQPSTRCSPSCPAAARPRPRPCGRRAGRGAARGRERAAAAARQLPRARGRAACAGRRGGARGARTRLGPVLRLPGVSSAGALACGALRAVAGEAAGAGAGARARRRAGAPVGPGGPAGRRLLAQPVAGRGSAGARRHRPVAGGAGRGGGRRPGAAESGSAGRWRSRPPTSGWRKTARRRRRPTGLATPTSCVRRGASAGGRRAPARCSSSRWPSRGCRRWCAWCRTRRAGPAAVAALGGAAVDLWSTR
jgi:succinyl-CoA synthetase alpha subunit